MYVRWRFLSWNDLSNYTRAGAFNPPASRRSTWNRMFVARQWRTMAAAILCRPRRSRQLELVPGNRVQRGFHRDRESRIIERVLSLGAGGMIGSRLLPLR